jgi:hypothetical protein
MDHSQAQSWAEQILNLSKEIARLSALLSEHESQAMREEAEEAGATAQPTLAMMRMGS